MKIKTALLTGNALRYALALVADMSFYMWKDVEWEDDQYWLLWPDGTIRHSVEDQNNCSMNRRYFHTYWKPDENQGQGGELLDKFNVCTVFDGATWIGSVRDPANDSWHHNQTGKTRLLAGMRALVSYRLGSEIEVPDGIACT